MIIVTRKNNDTDTVEGIACSKILSVNPDAHERYSWIKYWDGEKVSSFKVNESVVDVATRINNAKIGKTVR